MTESHALNDHEEYRELAAWAMLNPLTKHERVVLENHLRTCDECSEVYRQYQILVAEGMPTLAAGEFNAEEQAYCVDKWSRKKLFDRIQAHQHKISSDQNEPSAIAIHSGRLRQVIAAALPQLRLVIAMFLVSLVAFVAYRAGIRGQTNVKSAQASADHELQTPKETREAVQRSESASDSQTAKIVQLQSELSRKEQELSKLRLELRSLQDRERDVLGALKQSSEQSESVTQQRDTLNTQLRDAQQAYSEIQSAITNLRSERDEALTRSAILESKVKELSITARNQERRLVDNEKFLASDRDIRDLMGARQLYIADVFDVDSHSLTRKPYGRVFYTQGKSLIFYAFDLDDQENKSGSSTYQVWGRTLPDEAKPLSLGILYMDNESNRRWVLRFDNPKQLEEIDAVFVTIEPHGGSKKPTSKPFLYAMLRKEANHP